MQFLQSLDLFDKWVQSDIKLLNSSSRIVDYAANKVSSIYVNQIAAVAMPSYKFTALFPQCDMWVGSMSFKREKPAHDSHFECKDIIVNMVHLA